MEEFWKKNIVNNHFLVALLVLGFGFLLWEIRSILVVVFISFIFMAAMLPAVGGLARLRVPRAIAALIVYFLGLGGILLLVIPLVPFLAGQFSDLVAHFPAYLERAGSALGFAPESLDLAAVLQSEMDLIGKNAVALTGRVFGGFFSLVAIAVLSLYLLLDKKRIYEALVAFFPETKRGRALEVVGEVETKLGMWLRGQMILSLAIGLASWTTLTIMGLPFAFPLAIIAGLLEIVPTMGPIISAVPAVIVALTISPTLALLVVGSYILIQLLENNLLVPKVMEKVVGLNPVAVIVGIMIGGEVMGVMGALLAVPVILVATIVVRSTQ